MIALSITGVTEKGNKVNVVAVFSPDQIKIVHLEAPTSLSDLQSEFTRISSLPESPENEALLDDLRVKIYEAK